ncbi:MAG: hypothetical protein QG671_1690 [Actinomycetota bacterium]|nr:hypothetical protein [Actinomycetota bacterium]
MTETALSVLLFLAIMAVLGVAAVGGVHLRRGAALERQARQAELTCRHIHALERDAGFSYSACLARDHCAADPKQRAELPR